MKTHGETLHKQNRLLTHIVVPSNMNPVGEEGNLFSALFDKVPATRAGNEDDIAGTVLYLVSRAGVSVVGTARACFIISECPKPKLTLIPGIY